MPGWKSKRPKYIRSIAFPAISCGTYRFPIEKAARIAINAIQENILKYPELEKIVLVDINGNKHVNKICELNDKTVVLDGIADVHEKQTYKR